MVRIREKMEQRMERIHVTMERNHDMMVAMTRKLVGMIGKMDAMIEENREGRRSRSHHRHQSRAVSSGSQESRTVSHSGKDSRDSRRAKVSSHSRKDSVTSRARHEGSQSTAQVYAQSRETFSRSNTPSQSQSHTGTTSSYHSSQSRTPSFSSLSRTHSLVSPRSQTSSLADSHNLYSLDFTHQMQFSLFGTPPPTRNTELKQTLSKSSVQELKKKDDIQEGAESIEPSDNWEESEKHKPDTHEVRRYTSALNRKPEDVKSWIGRVLELELGVPIDMVHQPSSKGMLEGQKQIEDFKSNDWNSRNHIKKGLGVGLAGNDKENGMKVTDNQKYDTSGVLVVDLLTTVHEASARTAIPWQSNLIATAPFRKPWKDWMYVNKEDVQAGSVQRDASGRLWWKREFDWTTKCWTSGMTGCKWLADTPPQFAAGSAPRNPEDFKAGIGSIPELGLGGLKEIMQPCLLNNSLEELNMTDGFRFDSDTCMKYIQNRMRFILAGNYTKYGIVNALNKGFLDSNKCATIIVHNRDELANCVITLLQLKEQQVHTGLKNTKAASFQNHKFLQFSKDMDTFSAGNDGLFLESLEATISKQLTVKDRKEQQKELFVPIESSKATEENKTSPDITSATETSFILKFQALKHMVQSIGRYWEGRGARKKLNGMAGSYSPP